MKALLFAAGLGERMRLLTDTATRCCRMRIHLAPCAR